MFLAQPKAMPANGAGQAKGCNGTKDHWCLPPSPSRISWAEVTFAFPISHPGGMQKRVHVDWLRVVVLLSPWGKQLQLMQRFATAHSTNHSSSAANSWDDCFLLGFRCFGPLLYMMSCSTFCSCL